MTAMPDSAFTWTSAAATDVGCVRQVNEDTFLELPAAGLWVVADGMGGHTAGDYASGLIVEALSDVRRHDDADEFLDDVERRLVEVNRRLFERALATERTIGSTVAAVLALDNYFVAMWAGDSRVYLRGANGLEQITRDHSQVEELVAMGELAREDADSHPMANVITRAVGGARRLRLEARLQSLSDFDRVLLCSDGLFRDLKHDDLDRLLADGTAQEACDRLMLEARERGGGDNITAVVIDFRVAP